MNILQTCILFGMACSGFSLAVWALHRIADTLVSVCARIAALEQAVREAGGRVAAAAEKEREP